MIQAIVFDCFGVLYQGDLDYLYEITPEAKRQELLDVSHSSDFGYIDRNEYLARVSELTGKTVAEIDMISQKRNVRHAEMFDYIRSLKSRFKIGLLSNVGSHVIERLFTAAELAELFDATVFSSEVGMMKPFPEMYELMIAKLGLLPEACVMIDDTPKNIDGALAVGMQGILYYSKVQVEADLNKLIEVHSA